jgi:bifunctional DNA-binding transcriptional regulator/antitoxin component of YhaV-PrlF toxin-antitoxin module
MSTNIQATAIIRRNGRVTLPIELRRQMGITGGTKFAVTSDGKSIFLDIKNPDSGLADKRPPQRITICVDD